MLIVLVGARGAGKTTLQNTVSQRGVEILQPSTTRAPRFEGETEYDFVNSWQNTTYAWSIPVGDDTYGMRRSELAKAEDRTCITVFEPLNLEVFEQKRRALGIETMTVGLATIADLAEQHRRVKADAKRTMSQADLDRVSKIVSECDVVLGGDADTVAEALLSLVRLAEGRGGIVTRDHLLPLMRAGAMLTDSEEPNIRSASYDLRVGSEILFQGKVITLSPVEPRFEIPPYTYAIVSALEQASMPPFVIGRFDLKVSSFFEGLILSNGPQVDPGYKGALFCMLYNGSGRPRLLTLGKHFATIDFTTTTNVTEGYRQQYQLKRRMGQFLTDESVTGRGGAIVDVIDDKIAVVHKEVEKLSTSFWAIVAVVVALFVVIPAIVIPVAWIEIGYIHTERLAIEDAQRKFSEQLQEAKQEREQALRLLTQAGQPTRPAQLLAPGPSGSAAPNQPLPPETKESVGRDGK